MMMQHRNAGKTSSITDLPDDFLSLVYQRLESCTDRSSFGLVCRHLLRIRNYNIESLWDVNYSKSFICQSRPSPELFSIIFCKLLFRFQNLRILYLRQLPEVTNFVKSQSKLFGSNVKYLCLKPCSSLTGKQLKFIFSMFPRLTSVRLDSSSITDDNLEVLARCCASLEKVDLRGCFSVTEKGLGFLAKGCVSLKEVDLGRFFWITDKCLEGVAKYCASLEKVCLNGCHRITDKGLEGLAKSCASLENVDLTSCDGITDSGISYLLQNCSRIHTLNISFCSNVTGAGFLKCPKTLTRVDALGLEKLTMEGINAIASGGGVQSLRISGDAINTAAVIIISKKFPLLKSLNLESCREVQLEGWKAIGQYCKNLEYLHCWNLCDQGLKALCRGCNNLSYLSVDDYLKDPAIKILKRERPDVNLVRPGFRIV